MTLETVHIDKICRTCLSEENVSKSVFSVDEYNGENISLLQMLQSYTNIQILENDGLPSQVCDQCVDYINKTYSFKGICERSDLTLRQILGKIYTESPNKMKHQKSNTLDNSDEISEKLDQIEKPIDPSCDIKLTNLSSISLESDLLDIKILENFERNTSEDMPEISASLNNRIAE